MSFSALKGNSKLESLLCANTQIHNQHALPVLEVLRENKTLRILNFESNFLSGEIIVQILQAVNINHTLSELHLANQRQKVRYSNQIVTWFDLFTSFNLRDAFRRRD